MSHIAKRETAGFELLVLYERACVLTLFRVSAVRRRYGLRSLRLSNPLASFFPNTLKTNAGSPALDEVLLLTAFRKSLCTLEAYHSAETKAIRPSPLRRSQSFTLASRHASS